MHAPVPYTKRNPSGIKNDSHIFKIQPNKFAVALCYLKRILKQTPCGILLDFVKRIYVIHLLSNMSRRTENRPLWNTPNQTGFKLIHKMIPKLNWNTFLSARMSSSGTFHCVSKDGRST